MVFVTLPRLYNFARIQYFLHILTKTCKIGETRMSCIITRSLMCRATFSWWDFGADAYIVSPKVFGDHLFSNRHSLEHQQTYSSHSPTTISNGALHMSPDLLISQRRFFLLGLALVAHAADCFQFHYRGRI